MHHDPRLNRQHAHAWFGHHAQHPHHGHHGHHAQHPHLGHGHHGQHHPRHAAPQQHGAGPHRPGGGPGGFFGGFDGDGDAWRRGRKFSSDDLQLMLLGLIEDKPSHGYELIKALETKTSGFYRPSPGMVYPALTFLEEAGYATVDLDGNKKRYELSDAGRALLDQSRDRLAHIFAKLDHLARKMEWMRRATTGEGPEEGGWLPELVEARGRLKRALLARSDALPAEQRRIAEILARATAEIETDEGRSA